MKHLLSRLFSLPLIFLILSGVNACQEDYELGAQTSTPSPSPTPSPTPDDDDDDDGIIVIPTATPSPTIAPSPSPSASPSPSTSPSPTTSPSPSPDDDDEDEEETNSLSFLKTLKGSDSDQKDSSSGEKNPSLDNLIPNGADSQDQNLNWLGQIGSATERDDSYNARLAELALWVTDSDMDGVTDCFQAQLERGSPLPLGGANQQGEVVPSQLHFHPFYIDRDLDGVSDLVDVLSAAGDINREGAISCKAQVDYSFTDALIRSAQGMSFEQSLSMLLSLVFPQDKAAEQQKLLLSRSGYND